MTRRFALAGLLRIRGIQERAAAAHLSRAAIEQQRSDARDRQLRSALTSSADTPGDLRTLAAVAASRSAARSLLTDLQALQQTQRAALDDARERHAEARRAEHGLERLADTHARREAARLDAIEQAALDEIALRPAPGAAALRSAPDAAEAGS